MRFTVQPVTRKLWHPVALLTRSIARELGVPPTRPLKAELAILASPWLGDHGEALALLDQNELVGLGWTRDEKYRGRDCVNTGLILARPARVADRYHLLTDPLLESAHRVGRMQGWQDNMSCCRSVDTIHPPIYRALGFRDLPASWIAFSHALFRIPDLPLPPGLTVRPACMPEELPRVMEFAQRCFDDPENQGLSGSEETWNLLANELASDPEQLLVAEAKDGLAGYITLTLNDAPVGAAIIGACAVIPGWRRRGIASYLTCRMLRHCLRRKRRRVLVYELSTSPAGGHLWRLGPTRSIRR